MKYWQISNQEYAEQQAFYITIGYLQEWKKYAKEISVDEILNYMKKCAKESRDALNENFPEYAQE